MRGGPGLESESKTHCSSGERGGSCRQKSFLEPRVIPKQASNRSSNWGTLEQSAKVPLSLAVTKRGTCGIVGESRKLGPAIP